MSKLVEIELENEAAAKRLSLHSHGMDQTTLA
jgi:hypothetical protein